jgi:glycerol uptake facilitator protein
VANVLLGKTKGQGLSGGWPSGSGWIVITSGWAFAVMVGVFVAIAFGSAGAHINPAVTLAFAIKTGDYSNVITFWVAQLIGAFLGAVIVWLAYYSHWAETPDKDLQRAVFSTAPNIRNYGLNTLTEIIGTMVLVLGVMAIFSKAVGGPVTGLGPFLVGGLVWGIGLSLGGPTGYAINPARDLGPRIAHFVLPIPGKGDSDWPYSWVPVVGPLVGGLLAALLAVALGL